MSLPKVAWQEGFESDGVMVVVHGEVPLGGAAIGVQPLAATDLLVNAIYG